MVAKHKAKTMAGRRHASVDLPPAKRKKADDKDAVAKNKKKPDNRSKALKKQDLKFGDELEGAGFGEETQHFFERSSSEEDHQGSDIEAEGQEDGRLRMHADIFLEEPQYAGIQSNRKAAFEEEDTTDSEQQSGENADLNWSQEQAWDSDEKFEQEQHSIQDVHYEARDEEMEALDKEYEELQAQEEEMLRGLRGRSNDEVEKGQAVSCQKALWDKALEVRILLQKPFASANRLPLGDMKSFMSESNIEVENAFAKLTASSIETLGCLTETLKALSEQNGFINKASDDSNAHQESGGSPMPESSGDIDKIWQQLSALYSRFVPFRNSSVDRWQRKTQLSSGAAASKNKLRAFNQSISQQIETHMRDFSRMLERMWLKRSSVDVIGMPAAQDQNQTSSNGNVSDLQEGNKGFNGDPELIDDTEFYQELLREFLESSDPAAIGTLYAVRKLRNKKRKVVDRRASKGRKIRYNVHDKIVNFMAPIPMTIAPVAEKLFSNGLFQGGFTHVTSV